MGELRRRWWVVLVVTAVLGLAILVLSPHYLDVQESGDVATFRAAVDEDGGGRVVAGGIVDLAFAVAYALFARTITAGHVVARVGAGLVALGAAADLVENTMVITGVARGSDLTEGHVDTMLAAGGVKWAGIVSGVLALALGALLARRERAT